MSLLSDLQMEKVNYFGFFNCNSECIPRLAVAGLQESSIKIDVKACPQSE